MITGRQIRAARTLLKWYASDLADKTGLTRETISRIEDDAVQGREGSIEKILRAFDEGGVEFIGDRGVALRNDNYRLLEGTDCYLRLLDEVYQTLRSKPKAEVLSICTDDSASPPEVVQAIQRWHDAGIKCRFLSHEKAKRFDFPLREYRLLPARFFKNSVMVVFADKVATLRGTNETVLVINDRHQADMLRGLFEMIWAAIACAEGGRMTGYKVVVRNSPGWRDHQAATLGVSVNSPNWQGEKFASILQWTASRFSIIRIDVTDAFTGAISWPPASRRSAPWCKRTPSARCGSRGIRTSSMPARCGRTSYVGPNGMGHPGYGAALAGFQRAHDLNPALREAVSNDVLGFYRRQHRSPSRWSSKTMAETTCWKVGRGLFAGARIARREDLPGDELSCMKLVRAGLVDEAPRGLENEQFARIKLEPRARAATAEFPQKAFG